MEVLALVDDARGRTLATHVHLPAAAGPAPLVVFAHGLDGHPRKFMRLFAALTRAGYLVAAPAFPHTNEDAPGGIVFDDVLEQPADVSFVLDSLLGGPLAPRIDPERLALAGFSLGAVTVLGAAFDRALRDPRVRAVVAMSGRLHPFGGGYDVEGVPIFVVHGARDGVVSYAAGLAVFEQAAPPKALLTLHVDGHAPPFEDHETDADGIVHGATVAFLDLALGRGEGASARLDAAAASPLATLVRDGL